MLKQKKVVCCRKINQISSFFLFFLFPSQKMAFSAALLACSMVLASATSSSATSSVTSGSSLSSSSLGSVGSASNAYPSLQSLLAANPPSEQVVTLPASQPLTGAASNGYASQLQNLSPDQQELVVQHPNPRRILVRVVKPIIFEERIVIVPYRRVTHEGKYLWIKSGRNKVLTYVFSYLK